MNITKLGHCCLLVETKGKRILTDPGSYTIDAHSKLTDIDYILYTHEHGDHYHLDSLKTLLTNNPKVQVFANVSVGDLLEKENIPYTLVEDKSTHKLGDEVTLDGVGEKHAIIHSSLPEMLNVGLMIDGRLWYPGDSFTDPERPVEILALPIAGPWMKIGEAIDYALKLKPKVVFPVHDAVVEASMRKNFLNVLSAKIFGGLGIEFVPLDNGESKEFY